jgi:hypothetical protein
VDGPAVCSGRRSSSPAWAAGRRAACSSSTTPSRTNVTRASLTLMACSASAWATASALACSPSRNRASATALFLLVPALIMWSPFHLLAALDLDGKAAGLIEAKPEGLTLTGVESRSSKYVSALPAGVPSHSLPLPFCYETTGRSRSSPTCRGPTPAAARSSSSTGPRNCCGWSAWSGHCGAACARCPNWAPRGYGGCSLRRSRTWKSHTRSRAEGDSRSVANKVTFNLPWPR